MSLDSALLLLMLILSVGTGPPTVPVPLTNASLIVEGTPSDYLERLEVSRPLRRDIATQQTHSFTIELESGQYSRLTIESTGPGLGVSLLTPEGQPLIQVPCTFEDSLKLDVLAEHQGTYRLSVIGCGTEKLTGNFVLVVDEIRPGVSSDTDRLAAASSVLEAQKLRAQHSIASDREAVLKYQSALQLWRSATDEKGQAETLRAIGEMLQARGERTAALDVYKKALEIISRINDPKSEARILNDLGNLQILMGDSSVGLESCSRALNISRKYGDHKIEAAANSIIGEAYLDLGDLKKAIEYEQDALRLAQEDKNARQQARALLRGGYARVSLGDIQEGLKAYLEAQSLFTLVQDYHGRAFVLAALGHLHSRTGNKQKALEYYNEAASLLQRMEDPILSAEVSAGMAYVYLELGEPQTALDYYERSQRLYRALPDRLAEATTYVAISTVYHSLGQEELALNSLNRGAQILGSKASPAWKGYLNEQLGTVYEGLKQEQKALHYYIRALAYNRMAKRPRSEVSVLNRIGELQERLGESQIALRNFANALTIARSISDRFAEVSTLYNLAHTQLRLGNLDEAHEYIETAIHNIEKLRSNVTSKDLRASYFATVRQSYELNVDILMQLHKSQSNDGFDANGLELSERARSRSFLELLKQASTNVEEGTSPELLQKEHELEQILNAKSERQLRLLSTQQTNEASALADEITSLTRDYEAVKDQIRSKSPHYASLIEPRLLTAAEIQHLLDDDTLLLEYMVGDERSYVWGVTRSGISSYELPSAERIKERTQRLYDLIGALDTKQTELDEAVLSLSQMVLMPVASHLNKRRVVIVADGPLNYIPFQVLRASQNDEALVSKFEIINVPSASVLWQLRHETDRKPQHSQLLAAFGDAAFPADFAQRMGPTDQIASEEAPNNDRWRHALRDIEVTGDKFDPSSIQRLVYAQRELNNLRQVAGRDSLVATGFDATREKLQATDLSRYAILHFATHGVLDPKRPENSGLFLSMVDREGKPQNGFIDLQDIYNLRAPVDLVVLSACRTGLGKSVRGEGLIGLTRGFMYAGASSLVASLWKVDDEATAELMKQFYTNMIEKQMAPAAALREAQNTIRQRPEWRAPYYWAAFVYQGEYNNVIRPAHQSRLPVVIGVILMMLLATGGFFYHRGWRMRPNRATRR